MCRNKFFLFVLILSFNQIAFGAAIIPKDGLKNPLAEIKNFDTVSEEDFNFITQLLHKIYSPDIEEKSGLKFVMLADWDDPTVNAYATRSLDSWKIHVNGGFARAHGMTDDSLALSICHEIGHHLGGPPRTFLHGGWPSAEGQADYFATSKCLKRYYAELEFEDNYEIHHASIPKKVVTDCNAVYKKLSDMKICVRSQMASLDFAQFLNSFPDVRNLVVLGGKDAKVVKGTNTNDYPKPQCRFDTLYQGSLCAIQSNVASSDTDAKIGYCNDESKPGARPRCWYKP